MSTVVVERPEWLAGERVSFLALATAGTARQHHARSTYVETFWLPFIGPTSTLLLRRVAAWLDAAPGGVDVDRQQLAAELGCPGGLGRHSALQRTLERLCRFELATFLTGDAYLIRLYLPTLPAWRVARLPNHLIAAHEAHQ